ncbi:MAG: hypothetical protein GX478_02285 [Erysipelotrichaceae bacterium]|jgi:uncharacterized membrane protein YjjP (DUF1212 family)|nr:hypothetical protein [Erysipelotrichaceae bacterium]
MKHMMKTAGIVLLLLSSGCAAAAQAEQMTDDSNVQTAYGTVKSNDNGKVIISYETEDSKEIQTASVPSSAMVLKDSTTLHSEDLQKDEEISISFTNGRISVIQVLSSEEDKQ